jgi:hypothetical protein
MKGDHTMSSSRKSLLAAFSLALICLLAACDGELPAGGPYVWIDAPIDGLWLPVDEDVRIEGHAAYDGGIARVEIWVNSELHLIEENPPAKGSLAHFEQMWTPPGPGDYTIQAVAIGADGSGSTPDAVQLHVVEQAAKVTPTPTPTPVPEATEEAPTDTPTPTPVETATPAVPPPPAATLTPTPTQLPAAVIEFWADAEEVKAGKCTTIHWRVEHVKSVLFNDSPREGEGSHQTCPCADETHRLTVVLTDDTVEERSITIRVTGSCATPTPPPTHTPVPDTTAPPAPLPLKPLDGHTFDSCYSEIMLRWESVSDDSGIDEYRVQVESRPSASDAWEPVTGSPWKGLSKTELELDIEDCWLYRWRVRAVDKAGNAGPFSDWFEFVMPFI